MEALRRGVVESNRYPADQEPGLRTRMTMITGTAALQAHSALRYAEWRGVVAEWAAGRLGEAPDDLRPRVIGYAALGTAMASFERWVANEGEDLLDAARHGLRRARRGLRDRGGPMSEAPRFELDAAVRRRDGGRLLVGGTPPRLLRLSEAGAAALDAILAGERRSRRRRRGRWRGGSSGGGSSTRCLGTAGAIRR